MITFEQAYNIVTSDLPINPVGKINIDKALHHILAQDIASDMDMPPFHKAAVDGFACRRADLDQPLRLLETIPAGQPPTKTITTGFCSKIMTGAPVPDGADCVVMVEQTRIQDRDTVVITDTNTKDNIALKAEDIKQGEIVLQRGTLIQPQHIAVLATVGAVQFDVYQKVSLAVLSTGDELVEPHQSPPLGKIRNSNALQLLMQAQRIGLNPQYGGIVPDCEQTTRDMLGKVIEQNQVVILSGGVSMGDFDYVPKILQQLGLNILFKSIAIQPGKPTVFARSEHKLVFALPGNPISAFNLFELLAKPALFKIMGHDFHHPTIRLPMDTDYHRRSHARYGFIPAQITPCGTVKPIPYHGSAHINALVQANVLFAVPSGIKTLAQGELVNVLLI
jgi:molybdopterin molybdotransferase